MMLSHPKHGLCLSMMLVVLTMASLLSAGQAGPNNPWGNVFNKLPVRTPAPTPVAPAKPNPISNIFKKPIQATPVRTPVPAPAPMPVPAQPSRFNPFTITPLTQGLVRKFNPDGSCQCFASNTMKKSHFQLSGLFNGRCQMGSGLFPTPCPSQPNPCSCGTPNVRYHNKPFFFYPSGNNGACYSGDSLSFDSKLKSLFGTCQPMACPTPPSCNCTVPPPLPPPVCKDECGVSATSAASLAANIVLYINCQDNITAAAEAIVAASASASQCALAFSSSVAIGLASSTSATDALQLAFSTGFTTAATQNLGVAYGSALGIALISADWDGKNATIETLMDSLAGAISTIVSLHDGVYNTLTGCQVVEKSTIGLLLMLNSMDPPLMNRMMYKLGQYPSVTNCTFYKAIVGVSQPGPQLKSMLTEPERAVFQARVMPWKGLKCLPAARNAAAVAVSITQVASSCNPQPSEYNISAVALATASVNQGCAYATAVTGSFVSAPNGSMVESAFIATLAGTDFSDTGAVQNTTHAFVAAFLQMNATLGTPSNFMYAVAGAVDAVVYQVGCTIAQGFVEGFANMIVAINTDYYSVMTQAFDSYPRVMACKYMVTFPDNVTQKPLR